MIYKPTTILICHLVVLLSLVSLYGENNAQSSCGATIELNTIVDIRQSKENSQTTRVIRGWNTTSGASCRQKCCDEDECTTYVYYNSSERKWNCFIINCSPTSSCVRKPLVGSVVGVLKRNDLKSVDVNSHTVTSIKSNQGITLETSITQTPIDTAKPTAVEQLANREASQSKSTGSVMPTTAPTNTTPSHGSSSSNPVTPHSTQSQTSHPTTQSQKETSTNPSTDHNHTNNISLVIALFFGILFLLAVIVVVGRPWWEFIQRPRYSKVDYLMNGL